MAKPDGLRRCLVDIGAVMGWWTWGAVNGALVRRVAATVVNVSDRGCLIEVATPLEPGTIALLELHGSDRSQSEAVRVCHSIARPGSAVPFRAGTEFLVLAAPCRVPVRGRASPGRSPVASGPVGWRRPEKILVHADNTESGGEAGAPATR